MEREGPGNGGGGKDRDANDDRSDSLNPNNPAYAASEENRENQLKSDHSADQDDTKTDDDKNS